MTEPERLPDQAVRLGRRAREEPREPAPPVPVVEVLDGPASSGMAGTAAATVGRPPRWLVVALALLLVAGGAAWFVDHRLQAREAEQLAACQHRLEEASALSDVRLGAMADYLRPALWRRPGSGQLHLADLMSGPARQILPAVVRADRACRAVTVRPWHFTLSARRNAVTAYSGALVTLLQTVAAQGRTYFHHHAVLVRLRREAGVTQGPG